MIAIEQMANASIFILGAKIRWRGKYLRYLAKNIFEIVITGLLTAEDSTRWGCLLSSAYVVGLIGLLTHKLHSNAAAHQLIVLAEEQAFPLGATATKVFGEGAHIEGCGIELLFNVRREAPR